MVVAARTVRATGCGPGFRRLETRGTTMRRRLAAVLGLTILLLLPGSSSGQGGAGTPQGPRAVPPGLARAITVQDRHSASLLELDGVVGTGAAVDRNGQPVVKLFVERARLRGLPTSLDGVPVDVEVTGKVYARASTTDR